MSGGALQPGVAAAAGPVGQQAGPADRIMQGLLGGYP
jgi:hypothetical protein